MVTSNPLRHRDGTARLTVSVAEAARMLGISRAHAYEMAHAGRLPVLRMGSRYLVPLVQLRALIDGAAK